MAISYESPNEVISSAKAAVLVASAIKVAFQLAEQYGLYNANNDPDWNALQTVDLGENPQHLQVMDANRVIVGTNVTAAEVSNAIGSINVFRNFYKGDGAVAQSAWGNNIEKLAPPLMNPNLHNFQGVT